MQRAGNHQKWQFKRDIAAPQLLLTANQEPLEVTAEYCNISRKSRGKCLDNSARILDGFECTVLCDRQVRRIALDEAETTPLIGTGLLAGYEPTVQVRTAGKVTIRLLPKRPCRCTHTRHGSSVRRPTIRSSPLPNDWMRKERMRSKPPFYAQEGRYSWPLACLRMLLAHHGMEVSEPELSRRAKLLGNGNQQIFASRYMLHLPTQLESC